MNSNVDLSNSASGEELEINPQTRCLLYHLPVEIRFSIFRLVLTESNNPGRPFVEGISEADLDDTPLEAQNSVQRPKKHTYRTANSWIRPGCTSHKHISTALLQTCRYIHLEASHIAIRINIHRGYHDFGPIFGPSIDYANYGPRIEPSREHFTRLTAEQRAHVQSVHLYTQQHGFDTEGAAVLTRELKPVASSLEELTLTLRSLHNLQGGMLINPYRPRRAVREEMQQDMADVEGGANLTMPRRGWGGAFAHLPKLRVLTMEFEDREGRHSEEYLRRVVNFAQRWRFPLAGEGRVLVSESAPERTTWRALRVHDGPECSSCGRAKPTAAKASIQCESCQWRHLDKGARMVVYRVRWEAKEGSLWENMDVKPKAVRASVATIAPPEEDYNATTRSSHSPAPTSIQRPAYDVRLGGLNDIFAHANDEQLRELIKWGVL